MKASTKDDPLVAIVAMIPWESLRPTKAHKFVRRYVGSELLAKMPSRKKVIIRRVGSEADQSVATEIQNFLQQNGYDVSRMSIGMLESVRLLITKFSEHESDRGETQGCQGIAGEVFEVLGQSPASVEPGEGAFDTIISIFGPPTAPWRISIMRLM